MKVFAVFCLLIATASSLPWNITQLALDYFISKDVKYVCYISCENEYHNKLTAKKFMEKNIRISLRRNEGHMDLEKFLHQWNVAVGIMLDSSCSDWISVLQEASELSLFDWMHAWLIIENVVNTTDVDDTFSKLNLSVDADIAVIHQEGDDYLLTDIFNFGKIQGNGLEKFHLGTWTAENGLSITDNRFKYYRRWDFHNLTLRAVTVVLGNPDLFQPSMLLDLEYNPGVAAMTKVAAQLLKILRKNHNFRFKYTVVSRWIGEPVKNSTLTVTNSLFWREQDISCTMARIFPKWLEWVDIFYPPGTTLQTKFYYLIPDKGVGEYENRFLTPMSLGVWHCACAAGAACALVLAAAARAEGRPKPGSFALFSVVAAVCQQAYEDGVQLLEERFSSQGRRTTLLVIGLTSMLLYNYYTSSVVSWLLNAAAPNIASMDGLIVSRRTTLLVIGLTSMLLYNYYTSSVVSWLLNAAAPNIASMDGLIASDLELIFEDVGYARGWIANPGFYYFSGYKNPKEDELRDKKVTRAKRTRDLFMSPIEGMDLVRRGGYAYNTDPYHAGQMISRTFEDSEICKLGSLQMMPPAPVYIMGQKRGPFGQFFTWSLLRLSERGHYKVAQARVGGSTPACSGRTPRALALGQAAPAFLLLAVFFVLSVLILLAEVLWHRIAANKWQGRRLPRNNRAHNAQLQERIIQDIKKQ